MARRNTNYVTLSDILSLQTDIENFFNGETITNQTNCQILISFCERFKVILQNYNITQTENKLIYNSNNDNTKMAVRQIMVVGAQFVFKLRTFLLDEEIDFLIGGEDAETHNLKEITKKQSEVLSSLRGDLSKNAVLISSSLENVKKMGAVNAHINNLWKQIREFSSVDNIYHEGQEPDKVDSEGHEFYKKEEKDIDVYLRFATAKNGTDIPYKYYSKELKFFNNGWLFEWFSTLTKNNENMGEILKLWFDNSMTPLAPIILGMDNLPGYKGGDFSVNGKMYQAKFQNQRLITFNSILEVINNVLLILLTYQKVSGIDRQKQAAELLKLFMDANSSTINDSYDIIVDELLGSKLNK